MSTGTLVQQERRLDARAEGKQPGRWECAGGNLWRKLRPFAQYVKETPHFQTFAPYHFPEQL
jgi:hypothetical protein